MKMKLRNLRTGSLVEETYNTNIKVEKAHIDKIAKKGIAFSKIRARIDLQHGLLQY